MRKFFALAAVTMMTATGAMAQKSQPAGMRVEVCDAETDHGEYSIFTYQDTLSWVDFTSDDFKDEEVENRTKCHVYDEAAWTAKFGASVNLDFTGDLLKGKAYDGNYWTTFYDAAYGYEINAATTVPARKAFLALDDSGAAHARSLTMVFDDGQTGISGLTLDLSPKGEGRSYFSLDGRKFDGKPNKAGIYVNSGKKTVIK